VAELAQQGPSRQAINIVLVAGGKFPQHGLPFFMDELREMCRIRELSDQAANNLS
jgi:hypothetical protein